MMGKHVRFGLIVAVIALAAGCGDGDDGAAPGEAPAAPSAQASSQAPATAGGTAEPDGATAGGSPVPVPTNDPAYEHLLPSAVDLGEGWTREFDIGESTIADSVYCGETAAAFVPAATGDYTSPDGAVAVFVIIAPFDSEDDARAALGSHREAMEGCSELVSTDGVARTEWTFERADFGEHGDETLAIAIGGPAEGYFVLIRHGDTAIATGVLGQVTQDMAERIVERVDAAYGRGR